MPGTECRVVIGVNSDNNTAIDYLVRNNNHVDQVAYRS